MTMLRLIVLPVALSLILLIACGGGGAPHSAPANPIFTSTPVTSAAQGSSYRYTLAATDPSGGNVTFSLSQAPSGASLTGNTINWVPTAVQSRISNSFIAKATSSSGGSATQSWTVVPFGMVIVNWIDTYWTPAGPVQIPISSSNLVPSALVPQPDGSLLQLTGDLVSEGVYEIVYVPGGYYWLIRGAPQGVPPVGFWTSSSNFDIGRDWAGSLPVIGSSQTTSFDFSLSGLDPSQAPAFVNFIPANVAADSIYLPVQSGSTTLNETVNITNQTDWPLVNTAFLTQFEPISLGPFTNLVALGPELTLSNLTLNNDSNTIVEALTPSPQASLNLSIPGSQWANLFQNVGPSEAIPSGSWLSVAAEPYAVSVNATPSGFEPNLFLVEPLSDNGFPLPGGRCPGMPTFTFFPGPSVLTDQNLGSLEYGDPFPAEWTRQLAFCQSVVTPVSGIGIVTPLNFGQAVVPSDAPLAPLAGPVVNPMINGSSLFTTATVNTAIETLSWSAPADSSPYGYTVYVLQLVQAGNGFATDLVGTFSTATESITLPPLTTNNTYFFIIVTQIDGVANMETAPYRSQLPTAFATVMSAPITISAGASRPQLRGDPKQWERFLHPKGERHRIMASHN